MTLTGRCYCGGIHYQAQGSPLFRLACYCRECQYISGGNSNLVLGMPVSGFVYVNGTPKAFARKDLPAPVSREFCPDCGTHLVSRSPRLPDAVLLKVGTLDDPAFFQKPEFGIFAIDKQPFHSAPDGLTLHERRPSSYQ